MLFINATAQQTVKEYYSNGQQKEIIKTVKKMDYY